MINFQIIKTLVNSGNEICMRVNGSSMSPFLHNRDDYVLVSEPIFPLKKGDIAFFEDKFGRTVMHRVCKKTSDGYYFCGDAMNTMEGPVLESSVFAEVVGVIRGGKEHSVKSIYAKLFAVRARVKKIKYAC